MHTVRSGAELRVCLLHNYREGQQFSMKVYADQLGRALERQNVAVRRLRPREVVPARWRSSWLADKVDSYAGRFLYYPLLASQERSSDVYHVVDHGQAHLLNWLDTRRTVVTCHDLMLLVLEAGRLGRRNSSSVALEVFRGISRLLTRAAAVVADSDQTRRDLVRFLDVDPARIQVIFPGMNQPFAPDPRAREEGRRRWNIGDEKVVVQIGNAFYKNLEACLRVLAILRRRGLPVLLLRGGRVLPANSLALAERLGVTAYIRQTGPLADTELPTLYNSADALLSPSLYEGFGWPPLEAMACGVPVVCSRAGSLGEVAAPAALTADPEDADHLADHLAAILTDPVLAGGLRERGLAHAAGFDWAVTAAKFIDVYQRVREAA